MLDIEKIRRDFPMLQGRMMHGQPLVYLDNAATTFKPNSVIAAVNHYYMDITSNYDRGDYEMAVEVDRDFAHCRHTVATLLNCQDREVVFTSGASAALNMVAYGYGLSHLKTGDVILSTESEHASDILPWFKVCEKTGAKVEFIPLAADGRITIDSFRSVLTDRVKVVAVAAVSNVLGYQAPVKEICRLAHQQGAVVIVDGAQSIPHQRTDVQDMDCDFLGFSAHKCCGPTGVGVLYGKYSLLEQTEVFSLGGGSNARFDKSGCVTLRDVPYRFETGTPNIEGVMGMDAGLQYIMAIGLDEIKHHEDQLRGYMIQKMSGLDNVVIYNPGCDTGIVTFNVKGVFAQDAASYLDHNGIAVRSGLHCAKMLTAFLGTAATIRASLYFYNTTHDIDRLVEVLGRTTLQNAVDIMI